MASDEEAKGRYQPAHDASVGPEYDAEPDCCELDTHLCNLSDTGLPLPGDVGQKPNPVRGVLVEQLITSVAIGADAGGLNQDLRPVLGAADRLSDSRARVQPALQDQSLLLLGPAPRADIIAGQIHYRQRPVGPFGPSARRDRVPFDNLYAPGKDSFGLGAPTTQRHDLVPGLDQRNAKRPSDKPGRPGNQDSLFHFSSPRKNRIF